MKRLAHSSKGARAPSASPHELSKMVDFVGDLGDKDIAVSCYWRGWAAFS
jgi:hypothetical protein